ncbi:MAG: hypothetical protein U5K53_01960 [Halanaerobiales bacterium]|nr:hypothetical protein [Halanaerobiales bacterium]
MNNNLKYLGLGILFIGLIFLITACDSNSTNLQMYDLRLEVAGEGVIKDSNGTFITDSQKIINVSSNSTVDISADADLGSEFLFWSGDVQTILDINQTIYMDREKELISVFGDPINIFMAGYVSESWHTTNVIGYWKALMEYPNLEVYVREKIGGNKAERYIFDAGNYENDPAAGKIIYYQPDLANSEYIAALMRIEESGGIEATKYIFVYIDIKGFEAVILSDTPTNTTKYNEIIDETDSVTFINKIKNLIIENRDKDVIIGNTVKIYDQNITN